MAKRNPPDPAAPAPVRKRRAAASGGAAPPAQAAGGETEAERAARAKTAGAKRASGGDGEPERAVRAKAETELYAPVKRWLEAQGYAVRGEVRGCDVVAVRDDEPWPVVVELKKRFNLSLFLQAVERRALTPYVYVAAERTDRKNAFAVSELRRLCGLLGIGLLTVKLYKRKPSLVELHCEPAAPDAASAFGGVAGGPPKAPGRRTARVLDEFRERSGDYNAGGITGRKLVTAYREKALRCAEALHTHGPLAPRQVRDLIASDMARSILARNVYGWFRRVSRGVYALTPAGERALGDFADVVSAGRPSAAAGAARE